jgi:hypothetical protein
MVLSAPAQMIDIKYLAGDWNKIQQGETIKTDTLVFTKIKTGSTFRYWRFENDGDLNISSGYVTHDNKYEIASESENYKWLFVPQKNIITIKNKRKTESYKIIELSSGRMMLIRDE